MPRHEDTPWNADRVKAMRGALGVSPAEMARRLRVRLRTIEAISNGKMNATDFVAAKLNKLERPVQRQPKVMQAREKARRSVSSSVSTFLGR